MGQGGGRCQAQVGGVTQASMTFRVSGKCLAAVAGHDTPVLQVTDTPATPPTIAVEGCDSSEEQMWSLGAKLSWRGEDEP